jgi:drug/metabolite transporter (DMT)-like permease
VSQYHYTQLLTGALISYLVWHDKPGIWMWMGGALIIGAGLMIAVGARNMEPVVVADIAIR